MTNSRPSIEKTVQDLAEKQLKLAEHGYRLDPGDDLWTLGMTSLSSVGLMLAVEDAFGIEFPEGLLHEATFRSVTSIAAAVDGILHESQKSYA